jgi:SAM-dependent methyltransferase
MTRCSVVPGQSWTPDGYARNAGFVAALGEPVVALLAPRQGEHILDVGCGDGVLTAKLAAAGAHVVGIDASPQLVEAARDRGLDARLLDAHGMAFEQEFDAVFSNAALHWMADPARVMANIFRALKPGGRFVGEFGGKGNVRLITEALLAALARRGVDGRQSFPWYFPDAEDFSDLLRRTGFIVERAELFERPTPLPTAIEGWLATFGGPFLARVAETERLRLVAEVAGDLAPKLRSADGVWRADYVRLRFAAIRP